MLFYTQDQSNVASVWILQKEIGDSNKLTKKQQGSSQLKPIKWVENYCLRCLSTIPFSLNNFV